jgi:uncharacterized membrane protein YccC
MARLSNSISLKLSRHDVIHAVRTTVAVMASLSFARLFKLPEAYWAAVTTLVVMQSTLGASFSVSWQRFVGTAIGAAAGALSVTYFGSNTTIFAVGIFFMGIVCAALRLDRAAYRFAGVTLTIVTLIARSGPGWKVAVVRFLEVSIGIAVGLLLTALWPEPPEPSKVPAR